MKSKKPENEEISHWRAWRAPDARLFEVLAHEAFARLPEHFRMLCQGLLIRIEEFPDDEVVDEMRLDSPFDILGLYQGVDITRKSITDPDPGIDVVFLYRRPLIDFWAESNERLDHLVTHVLIHEIGHHFGLSDADIADIEEEAGLE